MDPQGVHVDAKGVLRNRTTDPDPRLAELWKNAKSLYKDGKFLYVSLPRLFAEARRAVEGGKGIPVDLRSLGGMTRLQYVFVYPDSKDLVIAGPAERSTPAKPTVRWGRSRAVPSSSSTTW
jgi:hypothetical protein